MVVFGTPLLLVAPGCAWAADGRVAAALAQAGPGPAPGAESPGSPAAPAPSSGAVPPPAPPGAAPVAPWPTQRSWPGGAGEPAWLGSPPRIPGPGELSPLPPFLPPAATVSSGRPFGLRDLLLRPTGQPIGRFELHPTAFLTEEYTDNFDQRAEDERENFRTTLGVGVIALYDTGRITGQIDAQIGLTHDTVTGEIGGDTNALLEAEASWELTPILRLTVRDTLRRSDDAAVADSLGLRRGRESFTSNVFLLQSDYRIATIDTTEYYRMTAFFQDDGPETLTHQLGAQAAKSFLETNFARLGYEYLLSDTSGGGDDISGHEVFGSVSRLLNRFSELGVRGEYAIRDVSPGSDYYLWSADVFGSYQVPDLWVVSASAGYSRLNRDVGTDQDTVNGTLSFAYRLARGLVRITGTAGFSETFVDGENFGVVETRGVEAVYVYPLTPFLTPIATIFYRQNEFTGVASDDPGRTEDLWGGSLAIFVPLRRWLALAVEYEYRHANSEDDTRDYVENRVTATVRAVF